MTQPTVPPNPNSADPSTASSARRRRPAIGERARAGGVPERQPRSTKALAVSVLLHVVAAVVVIQFLTFGHGLYRLIDPFGTKDPVEERLTYVEPRPDAPQPAPVATTQPTTPAITRPNLITGPVVGPVTSAPLATSPADTGRGAGAGDPGTGVGAVDANLRGAKPGYTDGRVWSAAGPVGAAPARSGAQKLDSVIASVLTLAADSLDSIARANGAYGRTPGDWTKTDKNGDKWGWDNAGIRLGKVTIPNALLSLLPLNTQVGMSGNPTAINREQRLQQARADIQRYSTMGPGDADFNKLKNELRQRRERERRDRLRAPTVTANNGGKPDGEKDK